MTLRCRIGIKVIPVLLLAALVCACAGKAVREEKTPGPGLFRPLTMTERLVATAQIDLLADEKRYPLRVALILQRPAYLRLEVLPVIGTPDFFLSATPDDLRAFFPSRGEFYTGKPTADHLTHFLPWGLSVEDAVFLLTGAFPFPEENFSFAGKRDAAGGRRAQRKDTTGNTQIIWMDREGRPDKVICLSADGADIYSAGYADYDGANRLAGKITLRWAKSGASVTVRYADWKIEQAADTAVFSLPYPPGVKIISLD